MLGRTRYQYTYELPDGGLVHYGLTITTCYPRSRSMGAPHAYVLAMKHRGWGVAWYELLRVWVRRDDLVGWDSGTGWCDVRGLVLPCWCMIPGVWVPT